MTAVPVESVTSRDLVARLMAPRQQRLVGAGNAAAGVLALTMLVWTYGLAEQMVSAQEAAPAGEVATRTIASWGPSISVTLATSLVLVGAAAGFVGSVVQQSIVFASRAGQQTLERGYVWWYVLRPVWSALLGGVVVITVNAGLVSIGDDTTSAAGVTVLVTAAAVAGLFTDQAMQRLRSVLGASDPARLTTEQPASGG
jgi:hypothetical protein